LARAASAGDGQDEGHATGQEQPPDEVPLDVLTRRAQTMFSGITGAVVASGDLAGTAAPTYALVSDVSDVIEALPGKLFDRHAEHRPCGLLCQRGAIGMLIADVLGLPLVPWVLAEPIGKAALKHKDAIAGEKKKAKKKAKRRSSDAEAAAAAVLRHQVKLPLPAADEIKAAWRQITKTSRQEPPAATPSPPPPPPPPAPPAEHVCSEACTDGMCPRARARIEAAMSTEAAVLIVAAFGVISAKSCGRDPHFNEELELADVRFRHALRRLQQAYPGEFCSWSQHSTALVIQWTLRCACVGHPIPAAEAAARRIGLNMEWAMAKCKADMEAAGLRVV
jgi:hypothetical protein